MTLIQNCGWYKVVERAHSDEWRLVQEFNTIFNKEIDTLGSEHQYHTWVRDKWIMFSPEVTHDHYQLTWDTIVPIPDDFSWNEAGKVLHGKENAWPLQINEWYQIKLTPSYLSCDF